MAWIMDELRKRSQQARIKRLRKDAKPQEFFAGIAIITAMFIKYFGQAHEPIEEPWTCACAHTFL